MVDGQAIPTVNPKVGLETRIENDFTYHPPKDEGCQVPQIARYELLRSKAKTLALKMVENCPISRELSLALTSLEEAVMWANAAISRNE